MENADSAAFSVDYDYRQTVGGQNCEQNAGRLRDQAVACEGRFGYAGNAMNEVRVNLAQRN